MECRVEKCVRRTGSRRSSSKDEEGGWHDDDHKAGRRVPGLSVRAVQALVGALALYAAYELVFAAAAEAYVRFAHRAARRPRWTKCEPPACFPYSRTERINFGVMIYAEAKGVELLRAFMPDPFDNNLSSPALELYLTSLEAAAENRSVPTPAPKPEGFQFSTEPAGIRLCSAFDSHAPALQRFVTNPVWFCCAAEGSMKPVCYLKMPKAASSSMHSALARLYRNCSTLRREPNKTMAPHGTVFVTSTREPWSLMRAAYAEIDGWLYSKGKQQRKPWDKSVFYRMSRRDEPMRFLAFIDDILNQRLGASPNYNNKDNRSAEASNIFYAAHAHPQLSQLLHMPAIHAIVRQETLHHDWMRLEKLLGVPPHRQVNVTNTNAAGSGETKEKKGKDRSIIREAERGSDWGGNLDPRSKLMKLFHKTKMRTLDKSVVARQEVCDKFDLDYECFGYRKPDVCR